MWALATALAFAGPPPNVDLQDIDKWEDAAEAILDLPRGCLEWVGQASWDWRTRRYDTRGDAVFAGKTRDGQWGEVHLQPLGELLDDRRGNVARVYEHDEARFYPLVGKLVGGRVVVAGDPESQEAEEGAEAVNLLRSAIRRISGDAFTSWAEWDERRGGVVLNRAIPLADGRSEEIEVGIFFPSGSDVPSTLDVTFPARFRVGRWPGWVVRDAEVHIRGMIRGNVVYPSSEAFRFDYRFLGLRFHGAQTLVYKRISRCADLPVTVVMPELPSASPPTAVTRQAEPAPPSSAPDDAIDGSMVGRDGVAVDGSPVSAQDALQTGAPRNQSVD